MRRIWSPAKYFLPCPDREKREILASAERFVKGSLESVKGVQCCGLGGCAPVKEPEIAKHMASALAGEEKVYSYCASCSAQSDSWRLSEREDIS